MPWKPKTPCQQPGCPVLSHEPYCETHRLAIERPRNQRKKQWYNRRWEKARMLFLRDHPLCVHCEGVTPATEVDHIIPHRGDMELFWDQSQWQALCKSCHSRKTASESGWTINSDNESEKIPPRGIKSQQKPS